MATSNPDFDAYIAKSADFAQPVLLRIRELLHAACPEVEEVLKWGMPSFQYRGKILCNMAAFKKHCAFGFWHSEMNTAATSGSSEAMGQLGKLTSVRDLPKAADFKRSVKAAMKLIDDGVKSQPTKKARLPAEIPPDLEAALRKNAKAKATFEAFSPSHRREYIEWISEAKRPETREKRLATTIEWLTEGKPRHWKYQKC